jgi:hypothetical protein
MSRIKLDRPDDSHGPGLGPQLVSQSLVRMMSPPPPH